VKECDMEIRNLVTGGVFSVDDKMAERLLAEGGYEAVDAPKPVKKSAPRRTHKTESE